MLSSFDSPYCKLLKRFFICSTVPHKLEITASLDPSERVNNITLALILKLITSEKLFKTVYKKVP